MKGILLFLAIFTSCLAACTLELPFVSPDHDSAQQANSLAQDDFVLHQLLPPADASYVDFSSRHTKKYDIAAGAFGTFQAHQAQINALVVSRDGTSAFSGGQDGTVIQSSLIPPRPGEMGRKQQGFYQFVKTRTLLAGSKPILALSLSPDEKKLMVARFSSVSIYRLDTGELFSEFTRIKGRILAVAWDPRQELVAFGRANGDVFVWNLGGPQGRGIDSMEALELYAGESSPVVSLVFHPSGRAIFVAQRDGVVSFWRLLRTERELGIRDDSSVADREKIGRRRQAIARLGSEVRDIWLNFRATELYVATGEGSVYRWKIRGIKKQQRIIAGTKAIFGLRGVILSEDERGYKGRKFELLATCGRQQRLSLWCLQAVKSSEEKPKGGVAVISRKEQEGESAEIENKGSDFKERELLPPGFVAQSTLFETPLTTIRNGHGSPLLWGSQKTGNLVVFDAGLLLRWPRWRSQVELCASN